MKVALLSDCYPPRTGGIESQVGDLAAQLAAAGHEVEVFTATAGGAGTEGVRVHRLSTPLSMGLPVNPFAPPEARRLLAVGGFDVAHVHLGVVSPFAWDMTRVTTSLGLPTALTWHCVLDGAAPAIGPAVRRWVRRGAVLSAVSAFAADGVRRAARGGPVTVLPNGIDPSAWPPGPVRTGRPVRVVSASRLAPRKRVGAMLSVVAAAHRRLGPGTMVLDVYGEGPLRPWLEARVAALGLADVVHLRGRVTRTELAAAWREADVYLSPTRLEAFGIAALEARTAGLPVVARGDSGVREVVADGRSGLLAEDDTGLADALVRLVADETLRTRIARHNTRTPPAQTWERVVDLAVAEYRRAGA
ncbi:glycosyltransferase family 4 protein [Janibacter terrae]|uniref:glycosyltransferase family 4 protein n=1 Tax=Janibacter terrae TaxID=103817 RepID=UPI0008395E72|nr:glycosyltransferase family 4 protein [Janibacter terrae]